MKMMEGAYLRATRKRSRMRADATPPNISTNSLPLALKKGTPLSPAIAFASRVFPVPGGPHSRMPCGHSTQHHHVDAVSCMHVHAPALLYFTHLHCSTYTSVLYCTVLFKLHAAVLKPYICIAQIHAYVLL